jgi:hypothetical protein
MDAQRAAGPTRYVRTASALGRPSMRNFYRVLSAAVIAIRLNTVWLFIRDQWDQW